MDKLDVFGYGFRLARVGTRFLCRPNGQLDFSLTDPMEEFFKSFDVELNLKEFRDEQAPSYEKKAQ